MQQSWSLHVLGPEEGDEKEVASAFGPARRSRSNWKGEIVGN